MDLSQLPQFTIDEVREVSPGDSVIIGQFSHLRGVRNDGGWLYRRPPELSLVGGLNRVPSAAGEAVEFRTPDEDRVPELRVGTAYPWIDEYWQAYQVDMILDGQWEARRFAVASARYFRLNGVTGWQADDGGPLPAGAEDLGVRAGGWDHEHCDLCNAHIDAESGPEGYVNPGNRWLCVLCFHRYAEPRDLAFLAGA